MGNGIRERRPLLPTYSLHFLILRLRLTLCYIIFANEMEKLKIRRCLEDKYPSCNRVYLGAMRKKLNELLSVKTKQEEINKNKKLKNN